VVGLEANPDTVSFAIDIRGIES